MATTNKWLLAVLVLLPTYLIRFELWGLPLNLLDLLVLGAFGYYLVVQHGIRSSRSFWLLAAALLMIGAVATTVADQTAEALGIYKSYVIIPILVGLMIQTTKVKLQSVLQALGGGVVFVGVVTLIQWLTGYGIPAPWQVGGIDVRMTSVFAYPNAVGLLSAPIVACSLAWVIHVGTQRLWFLLVTVMGLLGIGLSHSDGAIVAVAASVVFMLLFTRYQKLVIVSGIALISLLLIIPTTRQILLLQDTSGQVRLALWQGTWDLLQDHPWFGAGLGNFPAVYAQYKLDQHVELLLYPHNILLDFWVEFGLLGLIWLLLVVGRFYTIGFQAKQRRHSIIVMSGMTAMLVYGLVDVPYFKNDLAIVFWVLLALNDRLTQAHVQQ